MAARRRRTVRRRRRRAAAAPRVRRRTSRRRVYKVRASLHGLKRHRRYRTNPRRRRRSNPFKLGKGLIGLPPIKLAALAAGGFVLSEILLRKTKILEKLPARGTTGARNATGVVVAAAVGAVLVNLIVGKLAKKPALAQTMALGAFAVPLAQLLIENASVQKQLAGGEFDFGDIGGGEYSMPVSGSEYSMPMIGADDEGPDFGNM